MTEQTFSGTEKCQDNHCFHQLLIKTALNGTQKDRHNERHIQSQTYALADLPSEQQIGSTPTELLQQSLLNFPE